MKLGVLKIGADISAVTDPNQSLQQQYPTVFQGVGKLKTKQVKLYIDTNVTPVAQPLRRIPFNLRGPVEGILLSEKGIGPTEERVRAVSEAREPENASEVRSFLGLVSYSSRFIPQFATLSEPLRRLTRKDIPFSFGLEQKQAFKALKDGLAKAGTLAYFDKDAPTKVVADAGPVGLGAVLVQCQKGRWFLCVMLAVP
ncbi:hypothetical protein AAFF_G00358270 [Aldrovandia affinis]|uniref:Reverse transcriptase/retrotransposon-derived protein RNase H-like domain-containing protein n=1 Tax=Aldrovandia affinis TaxID=143900 RepID=A0AAD7T8S7_9TELE|nr:hypothetical protein AAFF_G00358270 [Aldrovandia affinis]